MVNFISYDAQAANNLNEKLSRTIFRNVEEFVKVYNSGLINKKYDQVVKIVNEITYVYKNVKEVNGHFVFTSEQEVQLEELAQVIAEWTILVKIKREVTQLIERGEITENDSIFFSDEASGYVLTQNEEGDLVKTGKDRVSPRTSTLTPLYDKYSTNKESSDVEAGVYAFHASDFTKLDDSFISKMSQFAPRN